MNASSWLIATRDSEGQRQCRKEGRRKRRKISAFNQAGVSGTVSGHAQNALLRAVGSAWPVAAVRQAPVTWADIDGDLTGVLP
jgi:hypothetical protein